MNLSFEELFGVSGVAAAYAAGLHGVAKVFELIEDQETADWIRALGESSLLTVDADWDATAKDFWQTPDSNVLISIYHRGLPGQLLAAVREDVELRLGAGDDRWLAELPEEAQRQCDLIAQHHLAPRADEFDRLRGHRLQAFPSIIAAQALPLTNSPDTRYRISSIIARLLRASQEVAHGFSESGADQINQIIPQVMVDQLIAGPLAWNRTLWPRPVLERLFYLGKNPSPRLETGLALSIQFLTYYRASLESTAKKRLFPEDCREQAKRIDGYFAGLMRERSAVVRSVLPWLDELQRHVNEAMKSSEPHLRLVRQSSAVVVGYGCGALDEDIPERLFELAVTNNLRAARRSFHLPDEQDRLARVYDFFVSNRISREVAERVVESNLREGSATRGKLLDFVSDLPRAAEVRPEPGKQTYVTARGHTLDELVSSRERIAWTRVQRERLSKAPAVSGVDAVAELAVDAVWPIIDRIVRWSRRDRKRADKLRVLVEESISEAIEGS